MSAQYACVLHLAFEGGDAGDHSKGVKSSRLPFLQQMGQRVTVSSERRTEVQQRVQSAKNKEAVPPPPAPSQDHD